MRINPVVRATGIIGATAALVTGVTFAALSSSATLTNNTIASATADLEVDNITLPETVEPGLDTDTGFAFTGVVPGGTASNTGTFTLTNSGTADMTVKVKVPTGPTWVGASVDDSKVFVNFSCTGGLTVAVAPSLTALMTGDGVALTGTLADTTTASCDVSVTMDAAAFSGTGVSTSLGFSLVFTGTGV